MSRSKPLSGKILMEAVSEANNLCPIKNHDTGEYYPGHPITPEMRENLR